MPEVVMAASGWLANYFVHSAVTMTALAAAVWLCDRLLRKLGPGAQHRIWVAALLLGAMLPLLPLHVLERSLDHGSVAASGAVTVTYRMVAAAERWSAFPLLCMVLAGLYLATVLLSLARLGSRWERTRAMLRRSVALPLDPAVRAMAEKSAARFAIPLPEMRCLPDACDRATPGPVVLGAWRARLLTPPGFFAMARGDAEAALAHECAHIARRDYAKNLLYEFMTVAVAYHPAARMMRRRLAETRELVCDEMAAGAESERPEYAAALLRLATAMASPRLRAGHAIGVFDGKILEERIMRLMMDRPKMSAARKAAVTLATACTLLGVSAAAMALSAGITPFGNAAPSPQAQKEKIYHVGNGVTAPVLTHSVDAEFSKKAKDAKYQGVSVIALVVDAQGMPQHVHTVRKLGMGLDEKAIEAVRQYRFQPSTLDGKPVAVALTIEVNFRLY